MGGEEKGGGEVGGGGESGSSWSAILERVGASADTDRLLGKPGSSEHSSHSQESGEEGCCPHFTDVEIEAPRGYKTRSGSHS